MPISSKLTIRQKIISTCRRFFLDHGFQEITIPILNSAVPTEPNIYPFTTTWSQSQSKKQKFFLTTSPESFLKQQISKSLGNCFAISPCFRNLENIGPHHHPEFLMLEWYEIGKNYLDVITTTQELLKQFKISNFKTLSLKKFFPVYPTTEPDFNQQFLNRVEPRLPTNPVFITDYPAYLSPLAAIKEGEAKKSIASPQIAQRFELYINKIEIANGCTENLHPKIPITWGPIPPCAGCGLGLDRLAMIVSNSSDINEIISPW